jgi:hypothetical protein
LSYPNLTPYKNKTKKLFFNYIIKVNILKKLFTMKTGFSPGAQFSIVSNEIEFILLYIKNMIYTPD